VGLPLNGTGELVRVEPFRDRYALDWRIVITMLGRWGCPEPWGCRQCGG